MQNGVGVLWMLVQETDGFFGWHYQQFDLAALGFLPNLFHHRHGPIRACADHQPLAIPRNRLFDGKRRVPKLFPEALEAFFFRFRISPRSITTS